VEVEFADLAAVAVDGLASWPCTRLRHRAAKRAHV
jgi:hypothetical protein